MRTKVRMLVNLCDCSHSRHTRTPSHVRSVRANNARARMFLHPLAKALEPHTLNIRRSP